MDIRRRSLLRETHKEPINTDNYLTIEALEDGLIASLSTNACEYCVDGDGNWKTLSAETVTESINNGHTLSFRGELVPGKDYYSNYGIGTFTINKKCNLKGNCISMLFGDNAADNFSLSGKSYAFCKLFNDCENIVNVSSNFLPATTLAAHCYYNMFAGCTSLTTAPTLPSMTLGDGCYNSMFTGCTSLVNAPELPATTLAISCYGNMFYNCKNLTTAPALPATTLKDSCYSWMFKDCKSLKTAPELPATTLAPSCYSLMFTGCTSLTTAPELPATTLARSCYNSMFDGTNVLPDCSNIDFTSSTVVASGGLYGLFSGTKVTDNDLERLLPKNNNGMYCLPVTELKSSCYENMFDDCTRLTTAPELPATTLADWCYYSMFRGCTSLTVAPDLPATTLKSYCYYSMFDGCTNLTTAPELPATTLKSYCYYSMFYGCKNLNHIKMLATDIPANNCLYNWVYRVANTGTFVKNPAMTTLPTGTSGIPSGWTVVNDGEESGGLITFTIEHFECQAEEGMTWGEWVDSEYNEIGVFINTSGIAQYQAFNILTSTTELVNSNKLILHGESYIFGRHAGGATD